MSADWEFLRSHYLIAAAVDLYVLPLVTLPPTHRQRTRQDWLAAHIGLIRKPPYYTVQPHTFTLNHLFPLLPACLSLELVVKPCESDLVSQCFEPISSRLHAVPSSAITDPVTAFQSVDRATTSWSAAQHTLPRRLRDREPPATITVLTPPRHCTNKRLVSTSRCARHKSRELSSHQSQCS